MMKDSLIGWKNYRIKIDWALVKHREAPELENNSYETSNLRSSKKKKKKIKSPVTVEWAEENMSRSGGIPKCGFAPVLKIDNKEAAKRVTSKLYRKLWCKASIKAQKTFWDNQIYVSFDNSHSDYTINSLEV